MEHQDWKLVTINKKENKTKKDVNKYISQKAISESIKLSVSPSFGKLIAQARGNKSRKRVAQELGKKETILTRWESSKDIRQNIEIAKIERLLKIKLPRVKKIKIDD